MAKPIESWDLFVSHATEDKKAVAEPLAEALRAFGVKVWFDKFTMTLGDSLSRSIDRGLAKSSYGLVVISPAFIAKPWTEHELRGLTAIELNAPGRKVILPIWHNVTKKDVLEFSPSLADKLAIGTQGLTPRQIAVEVVKTIRPDIFTRLLRRADFLDLVDNAAVKRVLAGATLPAPIIHETLPADLVGRIRLIRASLLAVYPHSMAFWLDGFQRDAHPSTEVAAWERIAAVYREYVVMERPPSHEQREAVYVTVRALDNKDEARAKESARLLPKGALPKIRALFNSDLPAFDFEDELPYSKAEMAAAESRGPLLADKEHLPGDLAEVLVREYMAATKDFERSSRKRTKTAEPPRPRGKKAPKPR